MTRTFLRSGYGTDREYFETAQGRLIDAKGVKARYIRKLYQGGSLSAINAWQEIEVYALPRHEPMARLGLLLAVAGALALRGPRLDLRPVHNDEGQRHQAPGVVGKKEATL